MAYLGNQPALSYTSFAKQDFTTSATTSYTLDNPVANENELALFINFVRQEPTTAYTASGTSLTLTSATSASDDMYCVYLGKAVQTVNPPNGSVGTAQLASGVLPTNTPAFEAVLSSNQSTSYNVATAIAADQEEFDVGGCYNNTGSTVTLNGISTPAYAFAPNVSGKYYFYGNLLINNFTSSSDHIRNLYLYKNGTVVSLSSNRCTTNGDVLITTKGTIELNGTSDYIQWYGQSRNLTSTSGESFRGISSSTYLTWFGAYRIGA